MTAEEADPTGSLALLLGADPGLSRTVLAAGTEVKALSPSRHLSMAPQPQPVLLWPPGLPAPIAEAKGKERETWAKGWQET